MMKYLLSAFLLNLITLVAHGENCETTEPKKGCECSKDSSARGTVLTGKTVTLNYNVTGMSCGGCSSGLSEKLAAIKGVMVEEVSHQSGSVLLHYKEGITSPVIIISSIEKAGYEVTGESVSLKISGMSCAGCEKGLSSTVEEIAGVKSVKKACHKSSALEFTIGKDTCKNTILKKIELAGYKIERD